MKYTLRQLSVFLATAHYENISRAADSLAMSQSAASGALHDLEQRYNTQLFDRVGKRLQLNALGHALRPMAEALMDRANEFETALLQHNSAARLTVGATLTIGNYVVVPIMAKFMDENPAIDVHLSVANTEHIVDRVLNFELDIGLIEGEYTHNDLIISPWQQDELVVFCSPKNSLAKVATLNDEQLLKAKWILRETGSGTRQTFDRAMQGILPELKVHLELEHTEAIKRAVEANLGIACLSKITVQDAIDRGSLVALSVPHRNMQRQFYRVIHKDKYQSHSLQQWVECCNH